MNKWQLMEQLPHGANKAEAGEVGREWLYMVKDTPLVAGIPPLAS